MANISTDDKKILLVIHNAVVVKVVTEPDD